MTNSWYVEYCQLLKEQKLTSPRWGILNPNDFMLETGDEMFLAWRSLVMAARLFVFEFWRWFTGYSPSECHMFYENNLKNRRLAWWYEIEWFWEFRVVIFWYSNVVWPIQNAWWAVQDWWRREGK